MYSTIDDSPSEFTLFREAVIKSIVKTYATTLEEVEVILRMEFDTLENFFEDDGSAEEAATVLAVLHNLEGK